MHASTTANRAEMVHNLQTGQTRFVYLLCLRPNHARPHPSATRRLTLTHAHKNATLGWVGRGASGIAPDSTVVTASLMSVYGSATGSVTRCYFRGCSDRGPQGRQESLPADPAGGERVVRFKSCPCRCDFSVPRWYRVLFTRHAFSIVACFQVLPSRVWFFDSVARLGGLIIKRLFDIWFFWGWEGC